MYGKLALFAFVSAILVAAGCSHADELMAPAVTAQGPVMKEKRALDKFTQVNVGDAIQADIKLGKVNSVTVECATSLARLVSTKVDGDTLNVQLAQRAIVNGTIKVHIIATNLDDIEASGAAKVYAYRMDSGKGMNLRANGASVLEVSGNLGPGRLNADGGSRTKLGGTAGDFSISADGASVVDATGLTLKKATVEAGGASTVDVGPSDEISATASGASRVHYLGNPTVTNAQANDASTVSPG